MAITSPPARQATQPYTVGQRAPARGSRLLRTATDIRTHFGAPPLCGCVLVAHDASQKASVGWVKARSAVPTRRRFGSPRGLRGACHRAGHSGPDPLAQPTLYSSLRRRLSLDIRPSISYMTIIEFAHRRAHSGCDLDAGCPRAVRKFPGGSGPPLGRHDDRSPRTRDRQIEAGNARQIGSQETRELELSQRRMRSPWRVPRRSAERRAARDTGRCRLAAASEWRIIIDRVMRTWTVRLSALRLPSGEAKFVARVEQRETRELRSSFITVPGFRSTQSGLRINSDAERIARTNRLFLPARSAGEGTTRRVVEGHAALMTRWGCIGLAAMSACWPHRRPAGSHSAFEPAGLCSSAVGSILGASLSACRYLLISGYTSLRTRLTTPSGLCSGKPCQGLNDRFSQKVARSEDIRSCIGMMIVATCSGFDTVSAHTIWCFRSGCGRRRRNAEGRNRRTHRLPKGFCSFRLLKKTPAQSTSSTGEGDWTGPANKAWRYI